MVRTPRTYNWDELSGEIQRGPAQNSEGWKHKGTKSGVKEFRSDRGHVGLETEAPDYDAAHKKFMKHRDYFAFHKG